MIDRDTLLQTAGLVEIRPSSRDLDVEIARAIGLNVVLEPGRHAPISPYSRSSGGALLLVPNTATRVAFGWANGEKGRRFDGWYAKIVLGGKSFEADIEGDLTDFSILARAICAASLRAMAG